jgi:hypothetical protein
MSPVCEFLRLQPTNGASMESGEEPEQGRLFRLSCTRLNLRRQLKNRPATSALSLLTGEIAATEGCAV